MRRLVARAIHPLLRTWYTWWNSSRREVRVDGLQLTVLPGVFHPSFFFSTQLMAHHVSELNLQGLRVLELGAGAGRIALLAARKGAMVTASDINPNAVESLRINSERNGIPISVVQSDLFEGIHEAFDLILINPPWYPRSAGTPADRAFNSGEGHDHFVRLFSPLAERIHGGTEVLMVLSEDLDRRPIEAIAQRHGLGYEPVLSARHWGERSTIFRISRLAGAIRP